MTLFKAWVRAVWDTKQSKTPGCVKIRCMWCIQKQEVKTAKLGWCKLL